MLLCISACVLVWVFSMIILLSFLRGVAAYFISPSLTPLTLQALVLPHFDVFDGVARDRHHNKNRPSVLSGKEPSPDYLYGICSEKSGVQAGAPPPPPPPPSYFEPPTLPNCTHAYILGLRVSVCGALMEQPLACRLCCRQHHQLSRVQRPPHMVRGLHALDEDGQALPHPQRGENLPAHVGADSGLPYQSAAALFSRGAARGVWDGTWPWFPQLSPWFPQADLCDLDWRPGAAVTHPSVDKGIGGQGEGNYRRWRQLRNLMFYSGLYPLLSVFPAGLQSVHFQLCGSPLSMTLDGAMWCRL